MATEDEIFAEATAPAPDTHADSQPAAPAEPAETPASAASEESAAEIAQPQEGAETEGHQPGGDLRVALRKEREDRKRLEAQILDLMDRVAPKPSAPEPKTREQEQAEEDQSLDEFYRNPTAWLKKQLESQLQEKISPVDQQIYETRKTLSEQLAVQQYGIGPVKEAYAALDAAIASGAMSSADVDAALRKSPNPAAEILAWHESQPQNAEKRLREKILEELRASGQIPAAGQGQAAPTAPSIPSLNRAVGNAGAQQSSSVTDEDIFNSAPAFGKRKA